MWQTDSHLKKRPQSNLSLNRMSMLYHFLLRLWGRCRSWGGESRATDRAVRREHCLLDTAGHCTVNSQQLGLMHKTCASPRQTRAHHGRGGGHQVPPQKRSYWQLLAAGRGGSDSPSCCQVNHTPVQGHTPRTIWAAQDFFFFLIQH